MREQDRPATIDGEPGASDGERQARVIQVLDRFTVIIDRGKNVGLELGEIFEVYCLNTESEGREDSPPELIKGLGEVVAVYKKTAALRSITPAFIVERSTAIPGYLGGPLPEVVGDDSGRIGPFEDPKAGDLARPAEAD